MQKKKLEIFFNFFFFKEKINQSKCFWLNIVAISWVSFPKPVMSLLINYCSDKYTFDAPVRMHLWVGTLDSEKFSNARNPFTKAEEDSDCPLLVPLRKLRVLGSSVLWERWEAVQRRAASHSSRLWRTDFEASTFHAGEGFWPLWVFLEMLMRGQKEKC